MPSGILTADTSYPRLEGMSTEAKVERISSYLFMLLEQLRYSMANLGAENFNETSFAEIAQIITEPLYVQLKNDEGKIAALAVTAEGLTSRMSDAEGNISALTQTSASLTSRIATTEGNVSLLQQTDQTLISRISNAEGAVSTVMQTVYGMKLSVTNGADSSSISLLSNGITLSSASITFTGMVTFAALSTAGQTFINGDNIKTGTIRAVDIYGCNITGSTFRSILDEYGGVGGEIEMCYLLASNIAGGIRLDDQGAGTALERKYRMFIYTNSILGVPFCMKLKSAGGMSIESGEIISVMAASDITILSGGKIELYGSVYINGVLFQPTAG